MTAPKAQPPPQIVGFRELNNQLLGITRSYDIVVLATIDRSSGSQSVDLDGLRATPPVKKSHKRKPAPALKSSAPPPPPPRVEGNIGNPQPRANGNAELEEQPSA